MNIYGDPWPSSFVESSVEPIRTKGCIVTHSFDDGMKLLQSGDRSGKEMVVILLCITFMHCLTVD